MEHDLEGLAGDPHVSDADMQKPEGETPPAKPVGGVAMQLRVLAGPHEVRDPIDCLRIGLPVRTGRRVSVRHRQFEQSGARERPAPEERPHNKWRTFLDCCRPQWARIRGNYLLPTVF
eukprot:31615-Pyramimonas_sp.AAC.1